MQLAALYVRRFSPEFRVAFDAWIKTKPNINPKAPPGPSFMREYHNALIEKGARLNKEATAAFTEGTDDREIADSYVRNSLLLAMILVLLAMAQRFKMHKVRIAVLLVAVVVIIYVFGTVATFPRL